MNKLNILIKSCRISYFIASLIFQLLCFRITSRKNRLIIHFFLLLNLVVNKPLYEK